MFKKLRYYLLYKLSFGKTRKKYKQKYIDLDNKKANLVIEATQKQTHSLITKNTENYENIVHLINQMENRNIEHYKNVDLLINQIENISNKYNNVIEKVDNLHNLVQTDINIKTNAEHFSNGHSQFGEDLILSMAKTILLNKKILEEKDITYIDIGANYPKEINNTYWLYKQGYHGILIEPNRILANRLKFERPHDTVLDIGIANVEFEQIQNFYQFEEWANGLSTFAEESAIDAKNKVGANYEVIPTKVCNINSILQEHLKTNTPFLMDIDVEGLDYDIIESLNLNEFRPIFFIIETAELSQSTFLGHKIYDCVDYLKKHNYVIYADTYINTILIDKDILEKMY